MKEAHKDRGRDNPATSDQSNGCWTMRYPDTLIILLFFCASYSPKQFHMNVDANLDLSSIWTPSVRMPSFSFPVINMLTVTSVILYTYIDLVRFACRKQTVQYRCQIDGL